MKLVLTILLIGMLLSVTVLSYQFIFSTDDNSDDKVYSGPVRPTDDEAYFRKTGITRMAINNG